MAKKSEAAEAANVETTETVEEVKEQAEQTAPAEETKTEAVAENATTEEVDVPEDAEEISQEEALKLANDEINRLREENTAVKQQLDDVIKKTNEEAAIAAKQILELEEKLKAAGTQGNNGSYLEYLNQLEAKFNEYPKIRRERLRREFVTDITEEIQRQKDLITNA